MDPDAPRPALPDPAAGPDGIDSVRGAITAGDYAAACEDARRLVASAQAQADDRLLAEALEVLSFALSHCGEALQALAAGLEGAALAARELDARLEAACRFSVGYAYLALGERADALAAFEQALALLAGEDEPALEARVLHVAGWTLKEIGRPDEGRDFAVRGLARARAVDVPPVAIDAMVSLGDIELTIAAGMPESPEREVVLARADAVLEQAVEEAQAAGCTNLEARAAGNRAQIAGLRGDHEACRVYHARVLETFLKLGDVSGAIETLLHLAESDHALGHHGVAAVHLRRCLGMCEQHGTRGYAIRAHDGLAAIAEADRDLAAALHHVTAARRLEREESGDRAVRSGELLRLRAMAEEAGREAARLREHTQTLARLSDELQREREMFATQALLDPLTTLANRRALERAVAALEHEDPAVMNAVAMADIDGFKAINDRFGHAVGDEVLRRLARLLEDFSRDADLVCRFGGEEFVLLLPAGGARAAPAVMERIRQAVERSRWDEVADGLTVTVSIGVAIGPAAETACLLERADARLYEAKRAGRNRVVDEGGSD